MLSETYVNMPPEQQEPPRDCPLYEAFALLGQALASPKRLALLNLLCQGESTVEALSAEIGQSVAATSAHLKVLRQAKLVENRRSGKFQYYRLTGAEVREMWLHLRDLASKLLPEARDLIATHYPHKLGPDTVGYQEVLHSVLMGEKVLLDLRPRREFEQGHLPGAINIPLAELESRLGELPKDKQILVYCRGPYCESAVRGELQLKGHKFNVIRLPLGVADWLSHGLSLKTA